MINKIKDFWEESSCGEELYLKGFNKNDYINHSKFRYNLEPEILDFINSTNFNNKKTLEIGVGLGSDHEKLAKAGAILTGIDLTKRAISHTKRRFNLMKLNSKLKVLNCEKLNFKSESFDIVYSWGVIHHSPNIDKAIHEIYRVLKPNGLAKIMIYNKYSLVGFMLWVRYALLKFRPTTSLDYIYKNYLESFDTKAYSYSDAVKLFKNFKILDISSELTHADLLNSDVGQRHRGFLLRIARFFWPRFFFKIFMPNSGLFLKINMKKL